MQSWSSDLAGKIRNIAETQDAQTAAFYVIILQSCFSGLIYPKGDSEIKRIKHSQSFRVYERSLNTYYR